MFAGRDPKSPSSSYVQMKQLFYEIRPQFPTVSDGALWDCIIAQAQSNATVNVKKHPEAQHMGHPVSRPKLAELDPARPQDDRTDPDDDNASSVPGESSVVDSAVICAQLRERIPAQRPTNLNIRPVTVTASLEPCIQSGGGGGVVDSLNNIHLGTHLTDKPPRSPSSSRARELRNVTPGRRSRDESVESGGRRSTASTPTQTTDTLLGGVSETGTGTVGEPPGMNFLVNVNCSVDYLPPSPTSGKTQQRRRSQVELVPSQPWLQQPGPSPAPSTSGRNYTSVNLMLRPPSSEPQPPIDITSRNSSLTYSTSSYDPRNGMQSHLQITVGPASGGHAASARTRPSSSCYPLGAPETELPVRAESLPDLSGGAVADPVLLRRQQQRARIKRLQVELQNEKAKLNVLHVEVTRLEDKRNAGDVHLEDQLQSEIRHLRFQCEQLASQEKLTTLRSGGGVEEHFYRNIYTGQQGPLNLDLNILRGPRSEYRRCGVGGEDGDKWSCHMCTFLNHPDLNKCEQCEMARLLRIPASPGDSIFINITPRLSKRSKTAHTC